MIRPSIYHCDAVGIFLTVTLLMGILCVPFACASWGSEPRPDAIRVVSVPSWTVLWDTRGWTLPEGEPIRVLDRWRTVNAAWIEFETLQDGKLQTHHAIVPWHALTESTKEARLP